MAERSREGGVPSAQMFALVVGVVYLILGIAGFFAVGKQILVLHTGALLDILRTAIGVLALAAARRGAASQVLGLVVFFGLTGLTVYGILAAATGWETDVSGVLNVHWGDNVLHGVTAIAGLVFGLLPARRSSSAAPRV